MVVAGIHDNLPKRLKHDLRNLPLRLSDVTSIGLTELGYGNNAVDMETTATFDQETKEFIVHTSHPLAKKYWITNGATHAKHVLVMAQLILGPRILGWTMLRTDGLSRWRMGLNTRRFDTFSFSLSANICL